MKQIIYILSIIFIIALSSCGEKPKYTVYWDNTNLCIVIPHPTVGVVGVGLIDWRGVELSDVITDVHDELISTNLSGTVSIWVRFELSKTDKYGNEATTYDDHLLAEISISEAKKFKSGKYLDIEYGLKDKLIRVVTEPKSSAKERTASTHETLRVAYLSDGTKVYLAPGDSLAEKYTSSAPDDSIDLITPSNTQYSNTSSQELKARGSLRRSRINGNDNQQQDSSSFMEQFKKVYGDL